MSKEWERRAKTPETRASIRRWNGWTNFFFWAGVLLVLGGIAFIVWSVATDRDDGLVFWAVIAGAVVLIGACVVWGSRAGARLTEARFADALDSIGTIVEATMYSNPDGPDSCDVVIAAPVSGVVIRRRLNDRILGSVGDTIRFRHNTLDPEDLDDILFVEMNGRVPRRSMPGWTVPAGVMGQSRHLYSDAQVSISRVVEVTSYPGVPGGAGQTMYLLTVDVELSETVTLHRRLALAERQLRPSGPAIRPLIRLRHNNRDPEDLSDAFFDGWADEARNASQA